MRKEGAGTEWIALSPKIRYLPAAEAPLSAQVVWIDGQVPWLFDLGAGKQTLEALLALPRPFRAVISHFHADHMENLKYLAPEALYGGRYTLEKAGWGTAVESPVELEPGLTLFPLPSCHARGSVGLLAGDYAFLGDGVYSTVKQGRPCYNTTLLKDTIDTLKQLPQPWFALSHGQPFVQEKAGVLAMLEQIYARRKAGCPVIWIDEY